MAENKFEVKIPPMGLITAEELLRELDIQKILMTEAESAVVDIQKSVNAGRGVEGAALREYSPGYKALKAAAGRSTTTNLTVTQQLMRSMTVKPLVEGKYVGAQIVFDGPHTEDSLKVLQDAAASRAEKGKKSKGSKARKSGEVRAAAPARSLGRRGSSIARISNVAKSGRVRGGGGEPQLSNAEVATRLYDRGFVGWFMLGRKQLERLEKNVNAAVRAAAKRVFTTGNAR